MVPKIKLIETPWFAYIPPVFVNLQQCGATVFSTDPPLKRYMNKRAIIRYFSCGFLILAFAIAVTPKIILHDLAAHHTDIFIKLNDAQADQINKSVFQCALDNLVAESPFVNDGYTFQLTTPFAYAIVEDRFSASRYWYDCPIFGLRGPPSFS